MQNRFYIASTGDQPRPQYGAADAISFQMTQNNRHNIRSDSRIAKDKTTESVEKLPAL